MRIWDRGRFAELGIDIRGGRLHRVAGRIAIWIDNHCDTLEEVKVGVDGKRRARMTRMGRVGAALSCFCEACIRSLLPWPLNW